VAEHYRRTLGGKIGLGVLLVLVLPERWVVAPAMVAALGWLVAVIAKVVPGGRLPLR
jgi:hypothetical protein